MSTTIKRLSLETIKLLVESGNHKLLARSPQNIINYKNFQERVLKEWTSMNDYVKYRYLTAYEKRIDANGKKYAVLSNNELSYTLAINSFPYFIDENLDHMTLWATEPLQATRVEEILNRYFDTNNRYWFEQPIDLKSIKGVWHVHVFVPRQLIH